MICGGFYNGRKCLKLEHGIWKDFSSLHEERYRHSIVTTQTGIFVFGGLKSKARATYECLGCEA